MNIMTAVFLLALQILGTSAKHKCQNRECETKDTSYVVYVTARVLINPKIK